jgi:hypothetical protein
MEVFRMSQETDTSRNVPSTLSTQTLPASSKKIEERKRQDPGFAAFIDALRGAVSVRPKPER